MKCAVTLSAIEVANWEARLEAEGMPPEPPEQRGSPVRGSSTRVRSLDAPVRKGNGEWGESLGARTAASSPIQETSRDEPELRDRWRAMPTSKRKAELRTAISASWRRQFGFDWDDKWIETWIRAPWVAKHARLVAARRDGMLTAPKGRGMGPRAFAIVWEQQHPVWPLPLPPEPKTGSTITPTILLVWASLLAGNWPSAIARADATPIDVLNAERETIKKLLQRWGLRSMAFDEDDDGRLVRLPLRTEGRPRSR